MPTSSLSVTQWTNIINFREGHRGACDEAKSDRLLERPVVTPMRQVKDSAGPVNYARPVCACHASNRSTVVAPLQPENGAKNRSQGSKSGFDSSQLLRHKPLASATARKNKKEARKNKKELHELLSHMRQKFAEPRFLQVAPCAPARAALAGRRTVNVAPRPGRERTVIRPLCASTILAIIANPKPVPEGFVV